MDKVAIFKKEYSYIKDINIKKDLKYLVSILPDYFFEIPASSTGKYHPSFSLGDGGLVRHTKVAVRIAHELLITETFGQAFTEHEKDLIIMALVLHDGVKCGIPESKFTRADHPLLFSKLIMENKDKLSYAFVTLALADTKYSLVNDTKFFCSQFVAKLLNDINIKTPKAPEHMHPMDVTLVKIVDRCFNTIDLLFYLIA